MRKKQSGGCVKILIIDDHGLFRAGLSHLLKSLDSESEVDDIGTIAQLSAFASHSFDLVILDYHLPDSSIEENLVKVWQHWPEVRILVISAESNPLKIQQMIDRGACGFIPKSADPQVLGAALRLILAGGIFIPSELVLYIQSQPSESIDPLDQLSQRQKDVLRWVIKGYSNQAVATRLGISLDTVKAHLSKCYRALGVHSRSQAIIRCEQLGAFQH